MNEKVFTLNHKGVTLKDLREGIDTYNKSTAVSTGYNKVKGAYARRTSRCKLNGNLLVAFVNGNKMGSIRLVDKDTHIADAMIRLKRDLKEMLSQIVIRENNDKEELVHLYKRMLKDTLNADYVKIEKTKDGYIAKSIFNVYESLDAIFGTDKLTIENIMKRR